MTRLLFVCLFLSMSACSSQKPFPGVIFIRNPCNVPLSVSVSKFSGYISSLEGNADEHFTLDVGQQKAIAQFQRSSKEQDLSWLFKSEYDDGFRLITSYGENQKEFNGSVIYSLSKKLSNSSEDYIYMEINSSVICP